MTVWVPKHCRARAGRPSQKDFKLGGPLCCCTVPGRGHRTGQPSGRRAIQVMQSLALVTVPTPGRDRTHRSTGAYGPVRPNQKGFKLDGPRCCCTVLGRGHRTGPP